MSTRGQTRTSRSLNPLSAPPLEKQVLDAESFRRVIAVERKRTERSKAPFVLMLLEIADTASDRAGQALESVLTVLTRPVAILTAWVGTKKDHGWCALYGACRRRQELDPKHDSFPRQHVRCVMN